MKKGPISFTAYFCFLTLALFFVAVPQGFAQQKKNTKVMIREQANRYYQQQNYDKAAQLFKSLYDDSGADTYFEYYLRCLIETSDYKTALKTIRQKYKAGKEPKYLVWQGYVYSREGDTKHATDYYQQALDDLQPERSRIIELGNAFYKLGEMDWAARVYREAQKKYPSQEYHYELAQIYFRTRNYPLMMNAYIDLLKSRPEALTTVEGRLMTAFYYDIDGELKEQMRKTVLARMQADPGNVVYTKLFTWFLIQQKNYSAALDQALALDRRTRDEASAILNLAQLAAKGGAYPEALRAYDYLEKRKGDNPYREEARLRQTEVAYQHFLAGNPYRKTAVDSLNQLFQKTFRELGESRQTLFLIQDYGRFLAFYLHQPDKAIELLDRAAKLQGISRAQQGELKVELADSHVCAGDYWTAVILYAQVAGEMRETALADEAKFKRARLAYYMGDFNWVKAQMDILKGSTSKLTANDALQLSLLIENHEAPDSLNSDLQMLARADLDQFCNRPGEALQRLDSLKQKYPSSDLNEEVLSRKAKILVQLREFTEAAGVYSDLLKRYPDGTKSDEARYRLGQLYEGQLNLPGKAEAIYRDIVLHHPGSFYIEEARKRFRALRNH